MDAIILLAEVLSFPLGEEERAGFVVRGVEHPQRLGGHISCLTDLCFWAVMTFPLKLNLETVWLLCRNDDRAKAIAGDVARVAEVLPGGPLQSVRSLVAHVREVIERGFSQEEMRMEYVQALDLLRPNFRLEASEVTGDIERSLRVFFRKNRGKEARFVHEMGKVMDVHVALWYVRNGKMDLVGEDNNIRKFMEGLRRNLTDRTARLYWERVKVRYLDLLLEIYPTKRLALAQ